ncbi:uncharacterized protein DS421_8g246580 [Arachis hypogaea]|nr:uncharacterized protein DS421_8g246580 [Arachis hypogaea]
MKLSLTPLLLSLFLLLISSLSQLQGLTPKCDDDDNNHHTSTLKVFHIFSPCSPFKPQTPISWEQTILQLQAKDQKRMEYLSSLVATRSVVPIASGRQITQSPTYIVRAKIGTPKQTLLMAMDTSNDVAWVPCSGCLGCSSSTAFAPSKSTTFRGVRCGASQCKQVMCIFQNP